MALLDFPTYSGDNRRKLLIVILISLRNSKCFELCAEHPRKTTAEATNNKATDRERGDNNIAAQTFSFRELASATKNFRQEYLLGEGGFGRVYKGRLEKTDQVLFTIWRSWISSQFNKFSTFSFTFFFFFLLS